MTEELETALSVSIFSGLFGLLYHSPSRSDVSENDDGRDPALSTGVPNRSLVPIAVVNLAGARAIIVIS